MVKSARRSKLNTHFHPSRHFLGRFNFKAQIYITTEHENDNINTMSKQMKRRTKQDEESCLS